MALHSSNLDSDYIDAEYSSGDSNNVKSKQYQDNNNNIDELSSHLSEMGCIVDAVKRPPSICMETCVYEEPERLNETNTGSATNASNEDYSDEFDEESGSDGETNEPPQSQSAAPSKATDSHRIDKPPLKLSKSCSGNFSKPPSISARSSDFGSTSTSSRSRRVNMSFSNERLRDIERQNHILLTKILSARKKSTIPPREQPARRPAPAAAQRRTQQRQIDHDNMILLKKIQRAKSSSCSVRR